MIKFNGGSHYTSKSINLIKQAPEMAEVLGDVEKALHALQLIDSSKLSSSTLTRVTEVLNKIK